MRINKPQNNGKIILTYNGCRRNLQNIHSRYFKIIAFPAKEIIEGIKESLLVKIKLFDNSEIAISLISNNLYFSNKVQDKIIWHQNENNYCVVDNIIVDEQLAVFRGSLIINTPFNDDILEESYNFMMIFIPSDEIKHHLTNNKIDYETH